MGVEEEKDKDLDTDTDKDTDKDTEVLMSWHHFPPAACTIYGGGLILSFENTSTASQ